ncbi:MAG: TTAGGG repeat binding factor [Claussenomyces sp. TS43310]|nr:MAG: TTAGGG repeat binding factor [Claussenomyces sp. TS43310]
MASTVLSEGPPIKYESPYSAGSTLYDSYSTPLKRRQSDADSQAWGTQDKRQRITYQTPLPLPYSDDEFTSLIAEAQAKATVNLGVNAATQPRGSSTNDVANPGTDNAYCSDPRLYMSIYSLPMLESLSTQLLATLTKGPHVETVKIITEPNSDLGQTYSTLKSLFDQTKKMYPSQTSFLSADQLNIREAEHRTTIRLANVATFVSSVFAGQEGFYEWNTHFLETFLADGAELTKVPGQLYLNLKTQMYFSAVSQEEQDNTRDEVLDEIFPHDLDDILRARHPGTELSQSELEFVNDLNTRREFLRNEAGDVDAISVLTEKYSWEDFLKSLSAHLKGAYEPLVAPYLIRHGLTVPVVSQPAASKHTPKESPALDFSVVDAIQEATQAATQQHTMHGAGHVQRPDQQQGGTPQYQMHQGGQPMQNGYGQPQYPGGDVPFHTQSAPTHVLYERARQVAAAKSSPHSRRPGLPSQRRPWTTEEENALMTGLDQVKGPHWSQILALYGGPEQILAVRNQVQLKDKARNLKLFFLKNNIEVPYYLQSVTGELKTRAPSQAARKEAEERAKLSSDEAETK